MEHAGSGEILLRATEGGETSGELELLAIDRGPGMRNLEQCRKDGYTTGEFSRPGTGRHPAALRRIGFLFGSGKGTVILARWVSHAVPERRANGASHLRIGAVNVSKRGQEVCGDAWGVEQTDRSTTLLVADGLGHGYEASLASAEAVRTLRGHPALAPKELIELSHKALRSSRGAAVAVARIDRTRGKSHVFRRGKRRGADLFRFDGQPAPGFGERDRRA